MPRGDTKPLAKELIARFGSFAGVLAADREALRDAGLDDAAIAAAPQRARSIGCASCAAEIAREAGDRSMADG